MIRNLQGTHDGWVAAWGRMQSCFKLCWAISRQPKYVYGVAVAFYQGPEVMEAGGGGYGLMICGSG